MAKIDISLFGDTKLEQALARLIDKTQKKIVRQAIRKEAKRAHKRLIGNIERLNLIDSGTMVAAYRAAKIRSASNKPRVIMRIGVENPKRNELGIHADDKYYYPYAVEYGHPGAPAKPFIRPAIDEHKRQSMREMAKDISDGIKREAKK